MIITRRHAVLGAASLGLLGACRETPLRSGFPEIRFAHKGAFRFAASAVEIASEYAPPMAPPHIDHLVPVSPLETLRRWGQDRLIATGSDERYVRYVVKEAALKETALPRTPGVRGVVTTDQTERYDITLAAAVELRRARGNFADGAAEARVSRYRTVAEGISLADREKVWHELIDAAMSDIDAELERQIRTHLTGFMIL